MFTSDTSPRRQAGLTIVELIIFIVIVSIAVVGILQTLAMTNNASADPVRRKQALLIAEGLIEEVQQAAFTFCDPTDTTDNPTGTASCTVPEVVGPEPSTHGRPFDNVNDYVTRLNEQQSPFTSGGVLTDVSGASLGVNGYSATLTLRAEALNGITSTGTTTTTAMNVLRATVQVTYGSGANDSVTLDAYRTRYAPQVAQ